MMPCEKSPLKATGYGNSPGSCSSWLSGEWWFTPSLLKFSVGSNLKHFTYGAKIFQVFSIFSLHRGDPVHPGHPDPAFYRKDSQGNEYPGWKTGRVPPVGCAASLQPVVSVGAGRSGCENRLQCG